MLNRRTVLQGAVSFAATACLPTGAIAASCSAMEELETFLSIQAMVIEGRTKLFVRAVQLEAVIREMIDGGYFDTATEMEKDIAHEVAEKYAELRRQMEVFRPEDYKTTDELVDAWMDVAHARPDRCLKLDTQHKKHTHEYGILPQIFRAHDRKRLETLTVRFENLKKSPPCLECVTGIALRGGQKTQLSEV